MVSSSSVIVQPSTMEDLSPPSSPSTSPWTSTPIKHEEEEHEEDTISEASSSETSDYDLDEISSSEESSIFDEDEFIDPNQYTKEEKIDMMIECIIKCGLSLALVENKRWRRLTGISISKVDAADKVKEYIETHPVSRKKRKFYALEYDRAIESESDCDDSSPHRIKIKNLLDALMNNKTAK